MEKKKKQKKHLGYSVFISEELPKFDDSALVVDFTSSPSCALVRSSFQFFFTWVRCGRVDQFVTKQFNDTLAAPVAHS